MRLNIEDVRNQIRNEIKKPGVRGNRSLPLNPRRKNLGQEIGAKPIGMAPAGKNAKSRSGMSRALQIRLDQIQKKQGGNSLGAEEKARLTKKMQGIKPQARRAVGERVVNRGGLQQAVQQVIKKKLSGMKS